MGIEKSAFKRPVVWRSAWSSERQMNGRFGRGSAPPCQYPLMLKRPDIAGRSGLLPAPHIAPLAALRLNRRRRPSPNLDAAGFV